MRSNTKQYWSVTNFAWSFTFQTLTICPVVCHFWPMKRWRLCFEIDHVFDGIHLFTCSSSLKRGVTDMYLPWVSEDTEYGSQLVYFTKKRYMLQQLREKKTWNRSKTRKIEEIFLRLGHSAHTRSSVFQGAFKILISSDSWTVIYLIPNLLTLSVFVSIAKQAETLLGRSCKTRTLSRKTWKLWENVSKTCRYVVKKRCQFHNITANVSLVKSDT